MFFRHEVAGFASIVMLILCVWAIEACSSELAESEPERPQWTAGEIISEEGYHVSFTFPDSGYALDNREELIKKCLESIEQNCAIIKTTELRDTLHVRFLRSREEMKRHTPYAAAGFTITSLKTVFIVANEDTSEVKPPIRHELMHLISILSWGRPPSASFWINEGLAAFAENNCNGYNVAEIYRYFLEKEMLIPIDSLADNFYEQPEMIAYHQAAFLVQSLLDRFGHEKLKELWTRGFGDFEAIYGVSFSDFQSELTQEVIKMVPVPPAIDWSIFQDGCK